MKTILTELHYLPNVQFFACYLTAGEVVIEQWENYQKGSYRNRAHIASANGLLRLSVPLQKGKNERMPIRQVRIAYDEPWPQQHAQAIRSAYSNAPYFDFYEDSLLAVYEKKFEFLFDLNMAFLELLLVFLDIPNPPRLSGTWQKQVPEDWLDYRNVNHPKQDRKEPDPAFQPVKYGQLFEEKHGFIPNLSALDLLFCTGPQSSLILQQSIQG